MNKILFGFGLVLAAVFSLTGCQNAPTPVSAGNDLKSEITLQEGDAIRIDFPGAPNLNVPQETIRRDGKITVGLAGEVQAAGLSPTQLQAELLAKIGDQLLTKEIIVTVLSSKFTVYIDGAVLRPGKVETDHPITIMEAIMEAGGFDYDKANTHKVSVIRHVTGLRIYSYYTLDMDEVLHGKRRDLFYLQNGDIVHVPQKFSWF